MNELASLLPSAGFPRFAFDCLWQSALVGALAMVVLRGAKWRPAARAWMALLAISACVIAPCGTWLARAGGWGCLPSVGEGPVASSFQRRRQTPDPRHVAVAAERHPEAAMGAERRLARGEEHSRLTDGGWHEERSPLPPSGLGPRETTADGVAANLATWGWTALACAWSAASLLLGARLLLDIAAVHRLRRDAQPCHAQAILAACSQAARRLGLRGVPRVAYSGKVSCPTVVAWGRPCILLPAVRGRDHSRDNRAQFDRWLAVFCHELGHVRRRDGWSGLAVEAISVLLPWQPLIWLLRREFQRGCEEACDDWALLSGVDPLDYAEALADWIPRRSRTLALGIRTRQLPIRRRIERLLIAEGNHSPALGVRWIGGSALLALGGLAALAVLQTGAPRELAADEANPKPASRDAGAAFDTGILGIGDVRGGPATAAEPTAAVAVLGDGRLKHWSYAQPLGFSPGSEAVFSAGRDGVVHIWNVSTGQPRATFVRPHVAAAASGDGRQILLATGEGAVQILDSMTGLVQQTLRLNLPQARGYSISLISASHDGTIVAAGGRYSTATEPSEHFLAAWNVRSEKMLMTVVGRPADWTPGARVAQWQCLTLSADGRRLAAAGLHHINCWDLQTGEQLFKLEGDGRISALGFSPDGQTLASGDVTGKVTLWRISDRAAVLHWEHPATISALGFSPDGQRLAAAAGDAVELWDLDGGASLWKYQPKNHRHRVRPLSGGLYFSSDGRKLSTGFANCLVLLDAKKGTELPLAGGAPAADFTALSAAAGGFFTGDAAGRLALWNGGDGRRERTWEGHAAPVDAVAVARAGDCVASTAIDGSLTLWDAKSAAERHTMRLSLLAGSGPDADEMEFSADGQTLAVVTRQRRVALWDVGSGALREELAWPRDGRGVEPPQAFPSAGQFLLAQWRTGAKTVLPPIGQADRRRQGLLLAVSPDGRHAAGGVYGSRLELWDLRAGRQTIVAQAHLGRLQSLVFSPDSSWLASAAEDGQVCFWQPQTGKRLASLPVGPPGGIVRKVAVSSDGRYLATLNGNGTASIHRCPIGPLAGLAGR